MFGLFGKKKERRHPVILDLSVKGKPDGWDELIRLGFEPVFVNHRPRPNGISGDYVQTRWRLKANPDVTCTVYDSWEGGGGATFLDFDAPWNPRRIHGGCNLSWPNYTLDRLHSLGKVLFEGDRSEFEEPDSGNLDLRGPGAIFSFGSVMSRPSSFRIRRDPVSGAYQIPTWLASRSRHPRWRLFRLSCQHGRTGQGTIGASHEVLPDRICTNILHRNHPHSSHGCHPIPYGIRVPAFSP